MRKLLFALLLVVVGLLAFGVRCHNVRDVFVEERIYFIDADCYSRMTRARMVAEGEGLVIKHHEFENWPHGVTPHTTAPMDWLIAGLKGALDLVLPRGTPEQPSKARAQSLDLAGAIVSPVLGALTAVWLCGWALLVGRHSTLVPRWAAFSAPLLFAISPIIVHGTVLGRPDHQSLVILLLAIAMGAEVRLMQTARETAPPAAEDGEARTPVAPEPRHHAWAITGGIASGLAAWVSLYEPAIMIAVALILMLLIARAQFLWRERWIGWGIALGVFGVGLAIDGWRIGWLDPEVKAYFFNWSRSIGELKPLIKNWALPGQWLGWFGYVWPALLGAAVWLKWRRSRAAAGDTSLHAPRPHPAYRPAAFLFGLLAVTFALTCWQLRWGYFFALVFAMSLPWQMAVLRRWWIAWPALVISLWPLAADWDQRLFPGDEVARERFSARLERQAIRQLAENPGFNGPFLAPWWISPSIAYWSRQPGVAGSSHQSLPGTVDGARFWTGDAAQATAIVDARKVELILADLEPWRIVGNSLTILGQKTGATIPIAVLLGTPHPKEADVEFFAEAFPNALVEPGPLRNNYFALWRVRSPEHRASIPAETKPAP